MRVRFYISLLLFVLLHIVSCGTSKSVHHKPNIKGYDNTLPIVTKQSDSLYISGKNFLLKNNLQQWELYVEGDPMQRGLLTGALSEPLIQKQERVFIDKIDEMVPSKFKKSLLRQFLKWYNRKLYLHVQEEYKTEIYGISQYTSKEYDRIAPSYLRSLYLHAAHDIGHALSDLALVQCSSFAVWGENTDDGSLLIARNFDFYAGDEFAQDKIISFIKPDDGHPFVSVVWGGMAGTLSGMNLEGLTVTINSGKSDTPLVAKTPISLLAREILQYAKNIDEAVAIAEKREVFVSEIIMVGSANDGKAVLIEISPNKLGVYEVQNSSKLVCSNHFQSEVYNNDENNKDAILNSHSQYRFERVNELLQKEDKISPEKAAAILRDKEGIDGVALGYGNEKAINQLLAHHGIIFKPHQKLVWISSNPYQLGEFAAYDLNEVFKTPSNPGKSLSTGELNIPKDEFINSVEYKNYEEFRKQNRIVEKAIVKGKTLPKGYLKKYKELNRDYWKVYFNTGVYYYKKGFYTAAKAEFEKALTKEITTFPSEQSVEKYLLRINKKLN